MTHILPDTSIQNTTRESPTPAPCAASPVTWGGAIINVVSSFVGISSGTMSTSLTVPQNSHSHICVCKKMYYATCKSHWETSIYKQIKIFTKKVRYCYTHFKHLMWQTWSVNNILESSRFLFTFSSLSGSLWSLMDERCERIAVHVALEHTTESPVCMSLGSTRVLNFTAKTFVSARRVTRPLRLVRVGSRRG